jgi:hypothetical protein
VNGVTADELEMKLSKLLMAESAGLGSLVTSISRVDLIMFGCLAC